MTRGVDHTGTIVLSYVGSASEVDDLFVHLDTFHTGIFSVDGKRLLLRLSLLGSALTALVREYTVPCFSSSRRDPTVSST